MTEESDNGYQNSKDGDRDRYRKYKRIVAVFVVVFWKLDAFGHCAGFSL